MHDARTCSTEFATSPTRPSAHLARAATHALLSREEERSALQAVAVTHVAAWTAVHESARGRLRDRAAWAAHVAVHADDDGSIAAALVKSPCPRVAAAASTFLRAVHRVETSNTRLVISVALGMRRLLEKLHISSAKVIALDDLVGWGWSGLRRAVLRFDTTRELRFSTYAVWWIKHAMRRAVQDHGRTVRLPVNAQDKIAALLAEVNDLVQGGLSREAAFEAAMAGNERLADTWRASAPAKHLDGPAGQNGRGEEADGETTLLDFIGDDGAEPADEALHRADLARQVADLMPYCLNRQQAHVLRRRLGDDEATLLELGGEMGLSRERIRQIERAGLERLQDAARRDGLSNDGAPRRRRVAMPMARVPAGEQVALSL